MQISLIVAVSANNAIGIDGDLPWRLSEDLKRFKSITMGKPMIMGRVTFESIGRALPGRRNIVLSRQAGFSAEGCEVVSSPDEAIATAGDVDEVMVIGGRAIYELFLPMADRIYRTRVHAGIVGDTFFPELDSGSWQTAETEDFPKTNKREHAFTFELLERHSTESWSV